MRSARLGIACALGGAVLPAAQAWAKDERVLIVSDEIVITFDAESIKLDGARRSFRVTSHLPAPDENGAIGSEEDLQVECGRRRVRSVNSTALFPNGVAKPTPNPGETFQPVVKDSFVEVLHDRLCAAKEKARVEGGIHLYAPGDVAARAMFALLKMGLTSEQAAELASYVYSDSGLLSSVLENQKIKPAQRKAVLAILDPQIAPEAKPPPPVIPLASAVASGHVGEYVHTEMELGAGILLRADGTFRYGLTVGSLDETAAGRWTAAGNRVSLVSEPRPVAPAITAGPASRDGTATLVLKVVGPSGRGVQGVDLSVGFDTGAPEEGYTQVDGWRLPATEKRQPRWVSFSMESYGLRSPRFPVNARVGNVLRFNLAPNDFGVVDLTGAEVVVDAQGLTIKRQGQAIRFDKRGR